MKDNFSFAAESYRRFRPTYPDEVIALLANHSPTRECVWDCGTGNGQAAVALVKHYDEVKATDLSAQQIANAVQHQHISYSVQHAEQTIFTANSFDAIVVAQAIHWLDFEKFYSEVARVAKPNAILAAIGYGLIETFDEADKIIRQFYTHTVGSYWDAERKFVDEKYTTIPFPFQELHLPPFFNELRWDINHLLGYLQTWSAVKHYEKSHQKNPLDDISEDLKACWGSEERTVRFEIFMRVGIVKKWNQAAFCKPAFSAK